MKTKRGIYMSRKVQTIYEYFKEYSEEMIDKVISDLNPEDKNY